MQCFQTLFLSEPGRDDAGARTNAEQCARTNMSNCHAGDLVKNILS